MVPNAAKTDAALGAIVTGIDCAQIDPEGAAILR